MAGKIPLMLGTCCCSRVSWVWHLPRLQERVQSRLVCDRRNAGVRLREGETGLPRLSDDHRGPQHRLGHSNRTCFKEVCWCLVLGVTIHIHPRHPRRQTTKFSVCYRRYTQVCGGELLRQLVAHRQNQDAHLLPARTERPGDLIPSLKEADQSEGARREHADRPTADDAQRLHQLGERSRDGGDAVHGATESGGECVCGRCSPTAAVSQERGCSPRKPEVGVCPVTH